MVHDAPPPKPGLRELKKQRAINALEKAAFELFARDGFDATTVEQIANLAEVSRASFFRYFKSKEDVLAGDDHSRRAAFMAELATRTELPLIAALREASRAVVRALDDEAIERSVTYTKVILSSRTLLGLAYEARIRWLRELEAHIRDRSPNAENLDVLAPVLADVSLSILETSMRLAIVHAQLDFEHLIEDGFALLDPALDT